MVRTSAISGKEALTGDWEELNKETYVCNVYLQNNVQGLLLDAHVN